MGLTSASWPARRTADGRGYWLVGDRGGSTPSGAVGFHGRIAPPRRAGRRHRRPARRRRATGWPSRRPAHRPRRRRRCAPPNSGSGRRIVYAQLRPADVDWSKPTSGCATPTSSRGGERCRRPAPTRCTRSRPGMGGPRRHHHDNMVRFARGRDLAIGFHAIPTCPTATRCRASRSWGSTGRRAASARPTDRPGPSSTGRRSAPRS